MKDIGRRVLVIVSDQRYASGAIPFPSVGTTGTVIQEMDEDGEYEVLFDDWAPVSVVDPGWFVHKSLIVFIDDSPKASDDGYLCGTGTGSSPCGVLTPIK